jgi:hypothetical protein
MRIHAPMDNDMTAQAKAFKKCPYCDGVILAAAIKCKYCRRMLIAESNSADQALTCTSDRHHEVTIGNYSQAATAKAKQKAGPVNWIILCVVALGIIGGISECNKPEVDRCQEIKDNPFLAGYALGKGLAEKDPSVRFLSDTQYSALMAAFIEIPGGDGTASASFQKCNLDNRVWAKVLQGFASGARGEAYNPERYGGER